MDEAIFECTVQTFDKPLGHLKKIELTFQDDNRIS